MSTRNCLAESVGLLICRPAGQRSTLSALTISRSA